jgi:hypothetical protein
MIHIRRGLTSLKNLTLQAGRLRSSRIRPHMTRKKRREQKTHALGMGLSDVLEATPEGN